MTFSLQNEPEKQYIPSFFTFPHFDLEKSLMISTLINLVKISYSPIIKSAESFSAFYLESKQYWHIISIWELSFF